MKLRSHQEKLVEICGEILSGHPIETIIADVTPGGGKSSMPVILAENLLPAVAEKICWISPRDNLKKQGESEFLDTMWSTNKRIRVSGNEEDPSRGLNGYATTYQAIGQNPLIHLKEFEKHDYILFLDEPHHISESSSWEEALSPLVRLAKLVVFASGTLSRKDGKKISFLNYNNDFVDLKEDEKTRIINYPRSLAIKEGAICPLKFKLIDGEASWKESEFDEYEQTANISDNENSAKAVFAALHTEYALQIINETINDWRDFLKIKNDSKVLIVSPNIKIAKKYQDYLFTKGLNSRIATSENTKEAQQNIDDFKNHKVDILVTVGMAYEGLNVKEITHIACLTLIRSMPWLEQCFARANRNSPNKTFGKIFAPIDIRFRRTIFMINHDQKIPIKEQEVIKEKEKPEFEGEAKPWIHPTSSQAEGSIDDIEINNDIKISPSEQENILKKQIRDIRKTVANKRRGATKAALTIFDFDVKSISGKKLDEMNLTELEKTWLYVRQNHLT